MIDKEFLDSFLHSMNNNFIMESKGNFITIYEKNIDSNRYKVLRFSKIEEDVYTVDIPKGRKWENIPIQGNLKELINMIIENFPWLIDIN